MNLLHMKYAVEIAETNSLNKAAELLCVGQPTLSRAIKELEASLGITIFERSAKGMFPTLDGELFIRHARTVLKQVDDIEEMFSNGSGSKQQFSISVPRASYISEAFVKFTKLIHKEMSAELFYQETNSMCVIQNILQENYKLGILRYAEPYDKYYKAMMDEKGFTYELLAEFPYVLLMGKDSPLAARKNILFSHLEEYMEIAHADPYVPSLPFAEVKKEEIPDHSSRQIFIFDRASQFELLSQNPETYMWTSPVPDSILQKHGLVMHTSDKNRRTYKDMLIHKKNYVLSRLDHLFIEQIVKSRRETFI